MGGIFASGAHGAGNPTVGRDDVSIGLVRGLDNLGFGNRALVRERRAEQQQLLVELFHIQDRVAAEIARADAQLMSAAERVGLAEKELQQAETAYAGSMQHLGEVVAVRDTKVIVDRTLDVISSLQSLARAYDNYFGSVSDYNTGQFRLYHALGYPAGILVCDKATGPTVPVDTTRPPLMAPVCASEPCRVSH